MAPYSKRTIVKRKIKLGSNLFNSWLKNECDENQHSRHLKYFDDFKTGVNLSEVTFSNHDRRYIAFSLLQTLI